MTYKCVPAIYRIIVLFFHEAGTHPHPNSGRKSGDGASVEDLSTQSCNM